MIFMTINAAKEKIRINRNVRISMELYEAADVDGASAFVKFTKITIPLLKPIIEYLVIMNIIWGFQLFDEPKVLFSSWTSSSGGSGLMGGPLKSCLTAIWYIYDTSFGSQMRYGKGAAAAYGTFLFTISIMIRNKTIL